ncbi:hypothetical protein [Nocardia otitidiscaviarum]|nr:hypothetical protein [Nocardia otitidiscaviarum]
MTEAASAQGIRPKAKVGLGAGTHAVRPVHAATAERTGGCG